MPPTYFPSRAQLSTATSELWEVPGGPADLPRQQLRRRPCLTIVSRLGAHAPGRLRTGALPDPRQGIPFRLHAAGADRAVSGAADADLPDVRAAEADEHRSSGSPSSTRRSSCRSASTSCATASRLCRASWRGRGHGRRQARGRSCFVSSCRRSSRRSSRSRSSPSSRPGTSSSGALVHDEPWIEPSRSLSSSPRPGPKTSLGGTDWGTRSRRASPSRSIPCILFYLLLQRYYVSGLTAGAVK